MRFAIHTILTAVALLAPLLPGQLKPCTFTRIDPSCGPIFAGKDQIVATPAAQYHAIQLSLTRAPKNARGVMGIGAKQTKVQFPGTTCILLTDPVVVLPFTTNSLGGIAIRFAVKGKLNGTVYAQCGVDQGGLPTLSNGLKVVCND